MIFFPYAHTHILFQIKNTVRMIKAFRMKKAKVNTKKDKNKDKHSKNTKMLVIQ